MKFIDLKDKDVAELQGMLKEKKSHLFELKLKLKTMQLSNPNELRATKRDIAKIMTAINAKKAEK